MTRIVILGDSLAMPRLTAKISYEDSYPYILHNNLSQKIKNKSTFVEVISRNRRANTSTLQVKEQKQER